MEKWKLYTPEGVQDILPLETCIKRELEKRARKVFSSYGFMEIETPTIEFYDTFSVEKELLPQEIMFKIFDEKGRILVLRPDMTIPVARMAATKFESFKFPAKISYIANTFRFGETGGGKQKEFTQAGIELLGAKSPEADAQVIATAIKTLLEMGLKEFQIDIGQSEFFKGIMENTGLDSNQIEQVRSLIDTKDFLGLEKIIKELKMKGEAKEIILGMPGYFGSVDVIKRAKKAAVNKRAINALINLEEIISIIDDYGYSKYVSIDLGLVNSLNYYSGVIFKGFTYGIGFPILSGGRYDNLIEKFGKNIPATGFSMGINMVMMALTRQKIDIGVKISPDIFVCYEKESRKQAVKSVQKLREEGYKVELDIENMDINKAAQYINKKEIKKLLLIKKDGKINVVKANRDTMIYDNIEDIAKGE